MEFYRSIPEACIESRSIMQRVIFLYSATMVNPDLKLLNLFNFMQFTQEEIFNAIVDPKFDTGDTELNLLARRLTISPAYDEKSLFHLVERPALQLFYGDLQIQ